MSDGVFCCLEHGPCFSSLILMKADVLFHDALEQGGKNTLRTKPDYKRNYMIVI